MFREYNSVLDQKCDLAFIFGNQDLFPYRADEAIKLYGKNLVNKLIVSGGIGVFNKDRKTPEAYIMRDYLLEKNIPSSDIIVESESINTTQNIQNTLAILENKYNYDINKLTWALVSSDFHLRRCFALFTNALNNSQNLTCIGAKDGITDIDSWYNNSYGKRLIITEALMLCYNAKHK